MALAMARPWKHPRCGVYWLRKRVPDVFREILGKREEKLSLRTRDIAESKVRHVEALAELDAKWDNLRKGQVELTERQAQEVADHIYDQMVQHYAMPQPHFYAVLSPQLDLRVQQAVQFIEQRLDNPPPIASIARYVGVSPRQLERLFNAALGCSPAAFRRKLRRQRPPLTRLQGRLWQNPALATQGGGRGGLEE